MADLIQLMTAPRSFYLMISIDIVSHDNREFFQLGTKQPEQQKPREVELHRKQFQSLLLLKTLHLLKNESRIISGLCFLILEVVYIQCILA